MKSFWLLLILCVFNANGQIITPLEKSKFKKLTSNAELIEFVKEAALLSKYIQIDTLALSPKGRTIPFLRISKGAFGKSKDKITAMIFAQQHGNEPSGKEGLLFLIKDIISGKLDYLLRKIDLILIPQINPDGGDLNQRRNGNGADLNRNHMLLSEPEVLGLNNLFEEYLPEITLDLHEYTSYSREWTAFGYIKNYDEQIGLLTNPNISSKILNFSRSSFLPFIKKYLRNKGFSSNEYIVGGPPNKERIRYSTVDINDGRQSFGILNTLSFIAEGKNGRDSIDNIKHRAEGQKNAALGLLEFAYLNSSKIRRMIRNERDLLIDSGGGEKASIKMEHFGGPQKHKLTLLSLRSNKDTSIAVNNFHYMVKVLESVKKPLGYLIPKNDSKLIGFLKRHKITSSTLNEKNGYYFEISKVISVKDTVLEELKFKDPEIAAEKVKSINNSEYLFVPINQIRANLVVLAFEPRSMLGLFQQDDFKYLIKQDTYYPIIKVQLNKNKAE